MALNALPAEHIGGPFGTKVVATVSSGKLVGPKINAAIPDGGAAGDWLTLLTDGRYAWINSLFCVAIGSTTPDGVEYEIYAI